MKYLSLLLALFVAVCMPSCSGGGSSSDPGLNIGNEDQDLKIILDITASANVKTNLIASSSSVGIYRDGKEVSSSASYSSPTTSTKDIHTTFSCHSSVFIVSASFQHPDFGNNNIKKLKTISISYRARQYRGNKLIKDFTKTIELTDENFSAIEQTQI